MVRTISHSDLSIVPDIVRSTARRIDALSSKSEALVANTDRFTANQVSHAGLADALHGFVGEWNRQVRSSSGHFTELASRLAETAQSYQDADNKVADQLTSSSRLDDSC
jgi:uncharacterized protein YukE